MPSWRGLGCRRQCRIQTHSATCQLVLTLRSPKGEAQVSVIPWLPGVCMSFVLCALTVSSLKQLGQRVGLSLNLGFKEIDPGQSSSIAGTEPGVGSLCPQGAWRLEHGQSWPGCHRSSPQTRVQIEEKGPEGGGWRGGSQGGRLRAVGLLDVCSFRV